MSEDFIETDLLDRVLSGEASPEEQARATQWLARNSAARDIIAALKDKAGPEVDVDAAWDRVRTDLTEPVIVIPLKRRWAGSWALRSAAMITIAIAVALIWQIRFVARDPVVVEAPRGQRVSVTLADGSRVLLAPGTRLTRPTRFGLTRTVELEGEALFDVAHKARRPFVVLARGTVTRVLGTVFTVQAWPDDDTVRVVVQNGRVSVRVPHATATLSAGGMATLAGGRIATADAEVARALAWTRGRIVLENERLDRSIELLERWLDVEIVLADPAVGGRLITASLPADSMADAIEAIGVALGIDVHLNGRQVSIGKPAAR